MKMIRGRAHTDSLLNDERHHLQPWKIIWDGDLGRFNAFRTNTEGY
jgi:hypothetical protein